MGQPTRGSADNQRHYLMAVDWVLRNTDATYRSWRTAGRRTKLAGGVPYRFVDHPIVGPQCVTVTLQVRDEDWQKVSTLDERFAMMAGSAFARVYRDLSLVRIEFTLPSERWRDVYLSELPHRPNAATIGQKALGPSARVGWDPPHKAVFGRTRSGKTICLADFIHSLAHHARDDYRMLILNPKNDPVLRQFARLPHLLAPVANNYDDSLLLLRYALREMYERRDDPSRQIGRWVVFVDEVAQLVDEHPTAGNIVTQLSQMAGGFNINLIVASQAANPTVFGDKGSLARANFPSRIVFQLPHDQSYLATGLSGQHTERLGGKGDGLAVFGDRVTRFRAALPQQRDYDDLPRADCEPKWPATDQLAGDAAIEWQVPPEMLHYALQVRNSATAIQRQFGGAMSKAQMVRDYAIALRRVHAAWKAAQAKSNQ